MTDLAATANITEQPSQEGGEIDEAEVMDMAQRLASARTESTASRGEMKATRERVLAYMLATDQKELKIGNVKFSVQDRPEPIKANDLYLETMRRYYGFKELDLDQLSELVSQTKDEIGKLRPVLSIRTARRSSAKRRSFVSEEEEEEENALAETDESDDLSEVAAVGGSGTSATMEKDDDRHEGRAKLQQPFYSSVSVIPTFSDGQLHHVRAPRPATLSANVTSENDETDGGQSGKNAAMEVESTPLPTVRRPSSSPSSSLSSIRRARSGGLYDQQMDLEYASDKSDSMINPAARLFLGPMPDLIRSLQQQQQIQQEHLAQLEYIQRYHAS